MKKTKLNLELLKKVRDRIAEIPESYDQASFYGPDSRAPCGTVACLAGETIIANAKSVKQGIAALKRLAARTDAKDFCGFITPAIPRRAATLIGLTEQEADKMFSGGVYGWPEPYKRQFQAAESRTKRAEIAVAYLDECLRRKAVTW